MISTEAAGLAIKIAKGLIKLTRRLDLVAAEKRAVQAPMALPQPRTALGPTQPEMIKALAKLLKDAAKERPDPLGDDRQAIEAVLAEDDGNPAPARMEPFMQRHLPEQARADVLDLDSQFMQELRAGWPDLPVDDDEIRISIYYIHPGNDERAKGYPWRIALTVIDVLAEFGAENMAIFTRDEKVQSIVGAVLRRFGEADLQTADTWSVVLRRALSATLNGALDVEEILDVDGEWLKSLLNALAAARESEGDNFLLGLLQGKGYPLLVGTLLGDVAGRLADKNAREFEKIAADVLRAGADILKTKKQFKGFFQDHWGDLLRAGFQSIETHGPSLLAGESPLLNEVLVAVAGTLSKTPNRKFLSSEILVDMVDTAIGAVAANPKLIENGIDEEWLAALVNSVAKTVGDKGIRDTFAKDGVESIVRDALVTFGEHPELIVDNAGLVQELVGGVLKKLGAIDRFTARDLGIAAIDGALTTLADHPELLDFGYPQLVASLARKVATLVRNRDKGINKIQGADILRVVTESMAENPRLLVDAGNKVAESIVDAVVKVSSGDDGGLLAGATLARVTREVVEAFATSGKAKVESASGAALVGQIAGVLTAGLKRAEEELGDRLGVRSLPTVLGGLVATWARGDLATVDPTSDEFKQLFEELAARAAA